MMNTPATAASPPAPTKEQSPWRRFVSDFFASKLATLGLVMLVVIVGAALLAPWIAPQNPYDLASLDIMDSKLKPGSESGDGSMRHWLGTDGQARDLFSAILYGMRTSLMVATVSVLAAFGIGATVGLIAAYFGGRVLHQFHLPGHPEILTVSNIVEDGKPIGLGDAGKYWHSDISYKELPSLGSLLHAQELPAEGGDTLFANMHLAYDTLPQALKNAIDGKRGVHSYLAQYGQLQKEGNWRPNLSAAQIAQVQEVVHPVVRTHPENGRRALFVSEGFTTRIEGLPDDESRALLNELFIHSVRPEHIYRHQWQPHDLVFWDNRSLIHLAGGTPDHLRRKLYRTTIEGDAPF
ncbi:hypothetical protein BMR85_023080 [Achromobacter sp. KAs 3-5]|nr:hypothetical protein BMR85_023080 [Achromobacter sp. KAs 3-5]